MTSGPGISAYTGGLQDTHRQHVAAVRPMQVGFAQASASLFNRSTL